MCGEFGEGGGLGWVTARMKISMGLLEGLRFRNVEMVLDQEVVRDVVVLVLGRGLVICVKPESGVGVGYSFAKTPLKAAQAPLAAASASQGVLNIIGSVVLWEERGERLERIGTR